MTRQPIPKARTGMTLVELLVALPLLALLSTIAVLLLLDTLRSARRRDADSSAMRELHTGAQALSAELRRLRPADLITWRDTLLEFEALIGTGMVCRADAPVTSTGTSGGRAIIVAAAAPRSSSDTPPDPAAATWHDPPQVGDLLRYWGRIPSTETGSPSALATALESVDGRISAVSTGTLCTTSPVTPDAASTTFTIPISPPRSLVPALGTPIRIMRRTRYSLYRASDGLWYLGKRALGPAGWDIVQPVAGPLASPQELGLQVDVLDAEQRRLSAPALGAASNSPPQTVRVAMHAPRRTGTIAPVSAILDSLAITVAFRSAPSAKSTGTGQ